MSFFPPTLTLFLFTHQAIASLFCKNKYLYQHCMYVCIFYAVAKKKEEKHRNETTIFGLCKKISEKSNHKTNSSNKTRRNSSEIICMRFKRQHLNTECVCVCVFVCLKIGLNKFFLGQYEHEANDNDNK